jgi:fatty acid-binding protein DegV
VPARLERKRVQTGAIVPLGVARSRAQAYQAMVDKVAAVVGKSRVKIAYVHAGAKQEVEKIKQIVETRLNAVESFVAELSPALSVHTGPGTAGLCYFPVER